MQHPQLGRRALLQAGALCGAASLSPRPFASVASALASPSRKTQRVIVVAFAGGVRTRETLGTPANVPFLSEMAEAGVVYPRTRTANLGHFGATLSLLTGVPEARGIRENARGPYPTLFEYARKDLGLEGGDVWICTSGGAQQTNYAYSSHVDYGVSVGANTVDGDGVFNTEFKDIVNQYGRPREMPEPELEALKRMRTSLGGDDAKAVNSAESSAKLERYILDELTSGTASLRGANAADAKALRVARNITAIFKPKLVGVVLRQADVAHGSYNAYVEVIRQNDAALGELWNAVRQDPELADSTAIVVLPEFGRDADLNARRGLDHGDGSDDLNYVSTVCWGPDFRAGTVVKQDVRAADVCPTVCGLLGADAPHARGSKLPRLFS